MDTPTTIVIINKTIMHIYTRIIINKSDADIMLSLQVLVIMFGNASGIVQRDSITTRVIITDCGHDTDFV